MAEDDKKLFSHPRWNDTLLPVKTGEKIELTPQQKTTAKKELHNILRQHGYTFNEDRSDKV